MSNYRKVLLVGASSSDNLGDTLICLLTSKMLKEKGMDVEISNVEFLPFFYKLLRKIKLPLNYQIIADKALIKKLKSTNYKILFAGGQMFFNYFIPYLRRIMDCAEKSNTPINFNSCGFGPLSEYATNELKQILNSKIVERVTVRDSIEKAKALTERAFGVPDVAICTNLYYAHSEKKSSKIGLGVIETCAYNVNHPEEELSNKKYLEIMFNIVSELIKYNLEIELFTTGIKGDQRIALDLKDYCRAKGVCVNVAKRPKTVEQLIKTITGYERIISSRLHSLIIAYSYGIPAIGLSWDSKVDDFYHIIGYEKRVFSLKEFSTNCLSDALSDLNSGVESNHKCCLQNQIINNIETYIL